MRGLVCLATLISCGLMAADWIPLFDGKTLQGWERAGYCNGKAEYTVEDGCIVGTTKVKTPNSFLLADKEYGNFILELEFKVPEGMNSGVQIRSICDPEVKDGRVHGYQVEIDPSPRGWTGGIYDEARRGWLYNITKIADKTAAEAAKTAFKADDWNHFRVEAINDRIRTWVNGVPVSDLTDGLTRKGVIALQVHATGDPKPMQIRWRNIRIQDLGDGGTTRDILGDPAEKMGAKAPAGAAVLIGTDGDVSGLRTERSAEGAIPWQATDGVVTIAPGKGSVMSRQEFRDFRMHIEFNVNSKPKHSQDDGNSGVYIQRRYELQILNSHGQPLAFNECGAIYRIKAPDTNASRPAGEWQSYDLVFRSPRWDKDGNKTEDARISVSQNGVLIHDNFAIPNKTGAGRAEGDTPGPIKLQDHGNPVQFRNVWVEELLTIDRAASEEEEAQTRAAAAKAAIHAYKMGDSRVPLISFEQRTWNADAATRAQLEADMVDVLADPKATDDGKDFACRMLLRLGSATSVPALAQALAVERLSSRACMALAQIAGAEATQALREGLGKPISATAKGGIMNALAARDDQDAVPLLLPFLKDKDESLVRSALASLGELGGKEATAAIQQAKIPATLAVPRAEALLGCADHAAKAGDAATAEALLAKLITEDNATPVRLGAYGLLCQVQGEKGVDVALSLLAMQDEPLRDLGAQLVPSLPGGETVTAKLCAALASLPEAGKVLLVPALGARGDGSAAAPLLQLAATKGPLQSAAIQALGLIGNAACVAPLMAVAVAGGDEAKLAADALGRLPDAEVDSELIASLKGDSDVPTKSVAVAVLARRGCAAAIPAMADVIASAADSGLSRDCWKALRDLTPGKASEFARLLALLPGVSDRSELRDAERTLSTVAGKVADTKARDELIVATLGKTKGPAKATAIDLAGKFPAPASLAVLTESLKDPEEAVQYAAVKALMDWSDSAPAPALLAFAKDTPSVSHHALAIRGYVRLVSTAAASEDELKTKLNAAMDIARRDEDKALIKAAMSSLRITDLKAKNGKLYELVPKGFQKGGLVYIDRAYVFTDIPEFLATADLIKTSMMDRGERAKDQTTFHINRPATIVVCYDGRAKTCPGWLKDWKKLEQRISTTDGACKLELYAKAFPAGKVEINGNSPVPDVSANHIIGVTSAPIP